MTWKHSRYFEIISAVWPPLSVVSQPIEPADWPTPPSGVYRPIELLVDRAPPPSDVCRSFELAVELALPDFVFRVNYGQAPPPSHTVQSILQRDHLAAYSRFSQPIVSVGWQASASQSPVQPFPRVEQQAIQRCTVRENQATLQNDAYLASRLEMLEPVRVAELFAEIFAHHLKNLQFYANLLFLRVIV